ncbi:MAG: response regulator [Oscillospiraceae bacterium]|nr:response regulator [Oscillospiraceae bacterium]
MKILLADPSEAWCDALEDQLSCQYQVSRCSDGAQLMPMILSQQPDLLVLGLDLPHLDGLALLHMIRASGLQVKILATATAFNEYASKILSEFGVGHVLTKPCTMCCAMMHIYRMLHHDAGENSVSDPEAELLLLGLRMKLTGFQCLCTAIRLLREDPNQSITKVLYPNVAKIHGGSKESVERAIRTAIRDGWMHRDDRVWAAYFTPNRRGVIEMPTNGEFITRIAFAGKVNKACG